MKQNLKTFLKKVNMKCRREFMLEEKILNDKIAKRVNLALKNKKGGK